MEDTRGVKRRQLDVDSNFERAPLQAAQRSKHNNGQHNGKARSWTVAEQTRINKIQEDERHREFLAKENHFLIQQKRKAAEIRVRKHRARPVDLLCANLRFIDPIQDLINDDIDADQLEYTQPESVIQRQSMPELQAMAKELEEYLSLEHMHTSREYWKTLIVICMDRQKTFLGKAMRSVTGDVDELLRPKTYEELVRLESQISRKLSSKEPIDTDYWQQLLESLLVYKAKAKLRKFYQSVLDRRVENLRQQNTRAAVRERDRFLGNLQSDASRDRDLDMTEPILDLNLFGRHTTPIDEHSFLQAIDRARAKFLTSGEKCVDSKADSHQEDDATKHKPLPTPPKYSSSFDKEVAKGIEEDEEVFASEERVETKHDNSGKSYYKPRKPRYFNRVQMGYDWNKYNQTHYDHENPPPKVVQGYKFHIFYPDLIDPSKAPTYKIIREGGRKKGESVAPAGEEDTCIIRFMSGPPYEDVAFRIVDRDWDYSAKHDRGFNSTFEDGILTLHFSFKKVYYRK